MHIAPFVWKKKNCLQSTFQHLCKNQRLYFRKYFILAYLNKKLSNYHFEQRFDSTTKLKGHFLMINCILKLAITKIFCENKKGNYVDGDLGLLCLFEGIWNIALGIMWHMDYSWNGRFRVFQAKKRPFSFSSLRNILTLKVGVVKLKGIQYAFCIVERFQQLNVQIEWFIYRINVF